MTIFKPRLEAPSLSDKHWIPVSRGGFNRCLVISSLSVLPNCVGYAWGRWHELLGSEPKLSRGNAENWFGRIEDEYERGQKPRLGSVICWAKGQAGNAADGAGHVAVVEDILEDGTVVTSNSNYAGTRFFMRSFKPPYHLGTSYTFQGFIHPPVKFVKQEVMPLLDVKEIAKEVILGKWGNGADRKARLELAGYNFIDVQREVNIMKSNPKKYNIKDIDQLAEEVIKGQWGDGYLRKINLESFGYDYALVQAKVNLNLSQRMPKRSLDDIARQVIRGDWGNGLDRKKALEKAGYNFKEVQAKVNQFLR